MPTLKVAIDASGAKVGANDYVKSSDAIQSSSDKASKSVASVTKSFKNLLALAGASLTMRYFINAALTQERAYRDLGAALDLVGDKTVTNMKILSSFATEMQKKTIYGDEELMSQMTYLKNLGVHTTMLKDASVAAIGLASKYRLDLASAMQLVGRAYMGQTQMLTRYGIVLKDSLNPQEKFAELLKIGASSFKLAEEEANTSRGTLLQLKNIIGDTGETIGNIFLPSIIKTAKALRDWLSDSQTDFARWGSKVEASINLVTGIGFDLGKFFITDFGTAISSGLNASLVIFAAWGKSLFIIMEKIFSDVAANIGVWIKRAMSDRGEREEVEKGFYSLLYNEAFPKGRLSSFGGKVHDQETIARIEREAADLADQRMAALQKLGKTKASAIPDRQTADWSGIIEELRVINQEALDVASGMYPTDLTDKLEERRKQFWSAIGAADMAFPKVDRRAQAAIDAINNRYPKDLQFGLGGETGRLTSTQSLEPNYDTKQLDDMKKNLEFELQILGKTAEERDRAIQKRQVEKIAIDELGMSSSRAATYTEELDLKLVELQKAQKLVAIADGIGTAFGNAFEDAVIGAKSLSDAVKALIQDIARLIIRQTETTPLAAGISAGLQGMFGVGVGAPAANAFGGVVDSKTYFAMEGGRSGMMGEAGPEGIFPLKRGKDGKLGVIASGSGSGQTVVQNSIQIVNNTSKEVDASVGNTSFDGKRYVTSIILTDLQSNGPISRAIK